MILQNLFIMLCLFSESDQLKLLQQSRLLISSIHIRPGGGLPDMGSRPDLIRPRLCRLLSRGPSQHPMLLVSVVTGVRHSHLGI